MELTNWVQISTEAVYVHFALIFMGIPTLSSAMGKIVGQTGFACLGLSAS